MQAMVEATNGSSTKSGGTLKFPTTDHEAETGGMSITFTEYKYSRPTRNAPFKPIATNTNISLPLPKGLSTSYKTDWQNQQLGAFGEFLSLNAPEAVKAASNFIKGVSNYNSFKDVIDGARSFIEEKKFASFENGIKNGLSAMGTDILTNNQLFQNASTNIGIARNPFLAAQFEGVQFRSFPFEYNLIPKNKQDSETIEKIIKAFKYGMHPSYVEFGTLKNALFQYPYIYKPQFTKSKYLFDFGFCVITDLSVDYHGGGDPIYADDNGDKIPMNIRLSFTMQEIEIITKESINNFSEKDLYGSDFGNGNSRGR